MNRKLTCSLFNIFLLNVLAVNSYFYYMSNEEYAAFGIQTAKLSDIIFNRLLFKGRPFFVLRFLFVAATYYRDKSLIIYSASGVLFVLLIMVFTMKAKIQNGVLDWFGKHVFSIYILQRIPMEILEHFGVEKHKYLFVAISFVSTVIFAAAFDKCMDKLDSLIYRKKKAI